MKLIMKFPRGQYSKVKRQYKKVLAHFGLKWVRHGETYTDGYWVNEDTKIEPEYPDGSGGRAILRIVTEDKKLIKILKDQCTKKWNVALEEGVEDEVYENNTFEYWIHRLEKSVRRNDKKEVHRCKVKISRL